MSQKQKVKEKLCLKTISSEEMVRAKVHEGITGELDMVILQVCS